MENSGLNSTFTLLWVLWFAAFLAIEFYALGRKEKGDTLTEHIRRWMALDRPGIWQGRVVLMAFLLWLVVHFFL